MRPNEFQVGSPHLDIKRNKRRFQRLNTGGRQVLRMYWLSQPSCGTANREKPKPSDKAGDLREIKVAPTPIDHRQKVNVTRTRPLRKGPLAFRELRCDQPLALNR